MTCLVDISRLCFKWVGLVVTVGRKLWRQWGDLLSHNCCFDESLCNCEIIHSHPKFMATSWGNPFPSHPTFSWQHLGATHFHLIPHSRGNILGQPISISSHILMVTNCTRTLFPSITSVPHHWFTSQSGRGRKPKGEKKSLSKCLNKASKAVI
jgi:hypothetical protein